MHLYASLYEPECFALNFNILITKFEGVMRDETFSRHIYILYSCDREKAGSTFVVGWVKPKILRPFFKNYHFAMKFLQLGVVLVFFGLLHKKWERNRMT